MQLIHKAIWIVSTVTVLSVAASITGQSFLVLPELKRIEAIADQKDIERTQLGIELVQRQLVLWVGDIAPWDDMMNYYTNPDPEYIKSNFTNLTLVEKRANLLIFVDNNGQVLWASQVNLDTGKSVSPDPELLELLVARADKLLADSPGEISAKALYAHAKSPLALAVHRVLNSDETGASPGITIVARFIDSMVFEEMATMLNLDFSATTITSDDTGPPSIISSLRRNDHQEIHWVMGDSQGFPMLNVVSRLSPRGFDDHPFSTPLILSTTAVIVFWTIVFYLLRQFLISPIMRVAVNLVAVRESGDYSLRMTDDQREDEIGLLSNECNALLQHVQEQAEALTSLSQTDGLTQMANRRHFDQVFDDAWALLIRSGESFGLMICDIDFFKLYNDTYGHPTGDATLQKVGQAIASCVRRDSDLAARVGGEEFAMLLPVSDLEGCKWVAKRILEAVQALKIPHEHSPSGIVSLSIGVAVTVPPRNSSSQYLYGAADRALYSAKENGRARFEVADLSGT
ncbi:MAG: hypothetical protein CMQ19_07890 [Gammaproteobacteria bacterium]|nr:hypothetical protein [Gammaproteobacteria bacterium]